MLEFENIKEKLIRRLETELPCELTYHNHLHTLDVLNACIMLAGKENITSADELLKLKLAALFHDAGFLYSYHHHEEESCKLIRDELKGKTDSETLKHICDMIMATHYPHQPKDKLAQILCDADLDYLGRDDFFGISQKLFEEFRTKEIVSDEEEWNKKQLTFFESHHYFTSTSKNLRQEKKNEHYRMIKELVAKN